MYRSVLLPVFCLLLTIACGYTNFVNVNPRVNRKASVCVDLKPAPGKGYVGVGKGFYFYKPKVAAIELQWCSPKYSRNPYMKEFLSKLPTKDYWGAKLDDDWNTAVYSIFRTILGPEVEIHLANKGECKPNDLKVSGIVRARIGRTKEICHPIKSNIQAFFSGYLFTAPFVRNPGSEMLEVYNRMAGLFNGTVGSYHVEVIGVGDKEHVLKNRFEDIIKFSCFQPFPEFEYTKGVPVFEKLRKVAKALADNHEDAVRKWGIPCWAQNAVYIYGIRAAALTTAYVLTKDKDIENAMELQIKDHTIRSEKAMEVAADMNPCKTVKVSKFSQYINNRMHLIKMVLTQKHCCGN